MTNFHDLKVRALSPKEREIATETLAAWLYGWSESFAYDTATIADARILPASMMAEAASLCEDEGCPQAGTVHVCISKNEPEGVKLISGGYERGDGSIAFAAPDPQGSIMRCLICRTTFYEKDGCKCEPRSGFDGAKR